VIMGSAACGWLMTFDQVPTRFATWVASTIKSHGYLDGDELCADNRWGSLDLPPPCSCSDRFSCHWGLRSVSTRCSSA